MRKAKKAVVIGAGFAGLSAAAYLAKAGMEVTVLEATNQPGGRARVMQTKGFTFDLGPSWYLMQDVYEEWFANFGHKPQDFYTLERLDPSYKVFTGQRQFNVSPAPAAQELFESIEPGSGARLTELLLKTEKEYTEVRSGLLALDGRTLRQAVRPDVLKFLLRPELAQSYHARIKKYVHDPDLQHVLEFMTVFMGGSPYNLPAYYSLLAHVDMNLGVWYPHGGFGAVSRGFESVAKEQGATICYNSAVTAIKTEDGRATAVRTKDAWYACDVLVANADYHHVESTLLPESSRAYSAAYWNKRQLSPSGLLITLGIKGRLPNLLHHNLFFDTDWDNHFAEVFDRQTWSADPLFYVCVPSKTDATVAPEDHENLFVLAPMAAGSTPDENELQASTNRIVRRIETAIGQSFAEDVVSQHVFGPDYFRTTFNAFGGNAFGLSHTLRQSAVLRPKIQSPKVKNLFYAGQYTNPGTGVPMVIQSGELAAKAVLELSGQGHDES